jgi:glycosyltransferase involved in cell wall biosynthesis
MTAGRMKRVVFIATNEFDAFAGSEMLWAESARRLAGLGHEVAVNAPSWSNVPERIAALKSQAHISMERRSGQAPGWRRLAAKLGGSPVEQYFRETREHYLRRNRPDYVVISQGGLTDGLPWMEACCRLGIPFVALVHLVADALWPSVADSERASAVYPHAKAVYFVSEENRAAAGRQLGCNFSAARIVRNPFNVDYDSQPLWPDKTSGWRLACVGRLGAEHKGQDLLVEILSSAKWRERPVSVTLFGQGHHQGLLKRLVVMTGCEQVKFGGYTKGIAEVWRSHHALIMPSRYEGLPIALVEAMLCYRPAIVTDVGGHRELVEDGKTGFVAAAPTLASVDAALERAWGQRAEWQAMGLRAGEVVRRIMPCDPVDSFIKELNSHFGSGATETPRTRVEQPIGAEAMLDGGRIRPVSSKP